MRRDRTFIIITRAILCALALVLAAGLPASPAAAQTPALTITEANLRLWPEYDDPGLLVIFSGTFADAATFPQEVAFPIPANARNVQATYADESGGLITQAWEIVDNKLTYSLPAPRFHIEYYVDRAPSGNDRAITYAFEAPYPVQTLTVNVQQPARATDFNVVPPAEETLTGEDGLIYQAFTRADLAAGEKLEVELRYTKTDSGLSAPQLAIPSTVTDEPAEQQASPEPTNWLPWILIGIGGAALLGAGGYWLWSRRAPYPATSGRPPARTATPRLQADSSTAAFCTQCGHTLRPDDRFCSQCGAPRR